MATLPLGLWMLMEAAPFSLALGERQKLAAGDIVQIPAGIPHQLLLDKRKPFTYFVIKVEKP